MKPNPNIELTPGKFFKNLSIIYFALVSGLLMFSFISFFMTEAQELLFDFEKDVFVIIVPVAAFFGVMAGIFVSNKQIDDLSKLPSLKDKLFGYQSACIIKYALIEGPALFGIVEFLQSGNLFYLIVSGLLIAYYLMLKPSKTKIESDLKLNFEHQSQFNEWNEIIT